MSSDSLVDVATREDYSTGDSPVFHYAVSQIQPQPRHGVWFYPLLYLRGHAQSYGAKTRCIHEPRDVQLHIPASTRARRSQPDVVQHLLPEGTQYVARSQLLW